MNRKQYSRWLWLAIALPGLVLGNVRDQPIEIQADRVEVDERRLISHYRGDVIFQQGGLRLEGDRVTIHRGEEGVQRLEAEGRPVRFQQEATDGTGLTRGEAETLHYDAATGVLRLSGNARLWQGADEFSGPEMTYYTEEERVEAGAEGGRVRALIHPRQEEHSTQ